MRGGHWLSAPLLLPALSCLPLLHTSQNKINEKEQGPAHPTPLSVTHGFSFSPLLDRTYTAWPGAGLRARREKLWATGGDWKTLSRLYLRAGGKAPDAGAPALPLPAPRIKSALACARALLCRARQGKRTLRFTCTPYLTFTHCACGFGDSCVVGCFGV